MNITAAIQKNSRQGILRALSKAGATPNGAMMAMAIASGSGSQDLTIRILKDFVERGADFKEVGRDGLSSMHQAALKGRFEVIAYLQTLGCSLDARGKDGITPLMAIAAAKAHAETIKNFGRLDGVGLDSWDIRGRSAIHYCGDSRTAQALAEVGASLDKTDKNGYTALMLALGQRRGEGEGLARSLVELGAKTGIVGHDGRRAAEIAENGSIDRDFVDQLRALAEREAIESRTPAGVSTAPQRRSL